MATLLEAYQTTGVPYLGANKFACVLNLAISMYELRDLYELPGPGINISTFPYQSARVCVIQLWQTPKSLG